MITPDTLPVWFAIPASLVLTGTLIVLKIRESLAG